MRAAIAGLLLGLTAAYPVLAALLWHTVLNAAAAISSGAGWALGQPAAVVALLGAMAMRRITRRWPA